MVNYILTRHGWPMIVVRSKNKQEYLEALRQTDVIVGAAPSVGARATVMQIGYFLKYFKSLVAREIQADIDFVTRKKVDVWWYDGEMITARSKNTARALRAMRDNPSITYAEMASLLAINPSAVQKLAKRMVERGYIVRQGGFWRVMATSIV